MHIASQLKGIIIAVSIFMKEETDSFLLWKVPNPRLEYTTRKPSMDVEFAAR